MRSHTTISCPYAGVAAIDSWRLSSSSRRIPIARSPWEESELYRMLLDHYHCHPACTDQIADDVHKLLNDNRRQALHRLIQQQETWIDHRRTTECKHLLLSAGELIAKIAPALLKARKTP